MFRFPLPFFPKGKLKKNSRFTSQRGKDFNLQAHDLDVMSLSLIRELTQRRRRRKENGKKAIGLVKQNNNFARASRFFVHFSAAGARLQRETA